MTFVTPLVQFSGFGQTALPTGMCRCPLCRDELVELPETSFSDTSVTVDSCHACRHAHEVVSVTVRRSAFGELLV